MADGKAGIIKRGFELIKQTIFSLKQDGISSTFRKVDIYLKCTFGRKGTDTNNVYKDVLFISGCKIFLPHPHRYRVLHQIEQLSSRGMACGDVYYLDLDINMVKYYSSFVFYRCPYTDTIGDFIGIAKKQNKTVLYDIDDLVIDTKYTDNIPYVAGMEEQERNLYDDGVRKMGKTLSLCDAAITTTEGLANELTGYISEVYINRNTASEEMVVCSEAAMQQRETGTIVVKGNKGKKHTINLDGQMVRLGYFSGSITHNDDFNMIMPAIAHIMKLRPNVRLCIVGELDVPDELMAYKEQIEVYPYVDYRELPKLICSVDINIIPLCDSVFNRAKSENKWVEAALVRVPSIASNVGAFSKCIIDNETGILCHNNDSEWIEKLLSLIDDEELRETISGKAYDYCINNCITTKMAQGITDYIRSKQSPSFAMVLPSTQISGGVMVALRHCEIMREAGYNAMVVASYPTCDYMVSGDEEFPVLWLEEDKIEGKIDKMAATLWSTVDYVLEQKTVVNKYYLVQGYEVDFSERNTPIRMRTFATYGREDFINYITISKWCEAWLKKEFGIQRVGFAPNGLERDMFYQEKRDFSGKIRILIEGDCASEYKNVDESFRITNKLDREQYEIWYLSYNGKPKNWYEYDRFLHKVEYKSMPDIYRQCHILLKTSLLESFSYPPLEMMATGGFVVLIENDGNRQFARNDYNCLTFKQGDIEGAINCINRIVADEKLRECLLNNGLQTADERKWDNIKQDIIALYDA